MFHDWVQGWGFNNRPVMPYAASWQSSDRDEGPCQCPAVAGTARVEVETVQDDQQDGVIFHASGPYFLIRPSIISISSLSRVVFRIVSGLRLMELMQVSTRNSAISG